MTEIVLAALGLPTLRAGPRFQTIETVESCVLKFEVEDSNNVLKIRAFGIRICFEFRPARQCHPRLLILVWLLLLIRYSLENPR